MITTIGLSLGLITLLFVLTRLVGTRQEQTRKHEYQRFLQEDRMHSTLEYSRDVTRQRRDSRVWR